MPPDESRVDLIIFQHTEEKDHYLDFPLFFIFIPLELDEADKA